MRVTKALPLGSAAAASAQLAVTAPGRAARGGGGSGEVSLSDVLVAAAHAGVLVDCIAPLAARLRERVIDPVVAAAVDVVVAVAGQREAVLECLPIVPSCGASEGVETNAVPAPTLAAATRRVRAVVDFLGAHAFTPVSGSAAPADAAAEAAAVAFAFLGSCIWYGPHLVSVCASSAAALDAVSLAAAVACEPPPPVLMLGTPPGGAAFRSPLATALWSHDAVSLAPSGLPVPHVLGPGGAAAASLQLSEQPQQLAAPRLAAWPRSHAAPSSPERGAGATQQQLHLAWAWGQLEGSLRVGLSRLLTQGGGAPDSTWGLLHCLLRLCVSGVPSGPPDAPASSSAAAAGENRDDGSGSLNASASLAAATSTLSSVAAGGAGGALAAFKRDVLRPAVDLETWLHDRGFVSSAEEGLHSLAAATSALAPAAGAAAGSAPHHHHHGHHQLQPPSSAEQQRTDAAVAAPSVLLRPLAAALADAEELYAHRLRVAVLSAARSVCLADYHNSVVVRGADENAAINHALAALLRPSAEAAAAAPAPLAGSIGETLLGWVTGSAAPPPAVGSSLSSATAASSSPSLPESGDSPDFQSLLFRLPTCQVSAVAAQLVQLAQAAMAAAEAAAAQPGELSLHTAWVLYRSAKDALGLLPSVIPLRCGPAMAASPRLAALLHNDCLFLAHHAVLLGWRYSNVLVPAELPVGGLPVGGLPVAAAAPVPVTFVDLLPMLRAMAQRALLGQVRKGRGSLRDGRPHDCALLTPPPPTPLCQVRKARASVAAAFTDAAGGWTLARATDDVLAVGGGDDDDAGAAWAVALENAAKAQVRPSSSSSSCAGEGGMLVCDWLSPPPAGPPPPGGSRGMGLRAATHGLPARRRGHRGAGAPCDCGGRAVGEAPGRRRPARARDGPRHAAARHRERARALDGRRRRRLRCQPWRRSRCRRGRCGLGGAVVCGALRPGLVSRHERRRRPGRASRDHPHPRRGPQLRPRPR